MKLDLDFEDEFQCKAQKRLWPARLNVLLLTLAATCGVACSLMAGDGKQKKQARPLARKVAPLVRIRPGQGTLARTSEPFVVMAPAEIDPRMIVPAPAGDEAMVFNPESGLRLAPGAAAPSIPAFPMPGGEPGQVPAPGSTPIWPVPAQHR